MDNYIERIGDGKDAELVCHHPKVEKVWLTGRMSATKEALSIVELNLLLKDGELKKIEVGPISCAAGHFQEAEDYLKNL